jgi:hypothetical protein
LAYRASSRRGYAPFALGILGATLALGGKFARTSDPLAYVGLAVLTIAALWNAWPRRAAQAPSCAHCAPREESMRNEARSKEVLS